MDNEIIKRQQQEIDAANALQAAASPAAPLVAQLVAQLHDDQKWTVAEQNAFAVFASRFPNESSQGMISLGDAWKAGRAFESAADPVAPLVPTPQPISKERDVEQLVNLLMVNPENGQRFTFAGPLESWGMGLNQVKVMDGDGNVWTLVAGLREGYKTEAQRNANLLRAVEEEIASSAALPVAERPTRLDILSLIHSQMHRVYASAIDREEIDTKYMREIEDGLHALAAGVPVAERPSDAPFPAPPQGDAAARAWQEGVLMAASIVIACHDMPVVAATILNELCMQTADCSALDEFDQASLRKVQGELNGGISLRGLTPPASQAATTGGEA